MIHDSGANEKLKDFYITDTGPYWDAERKYVENRYDTIPFPYKRIGYRTYSMFYQWTPEQMAGYLKSWSAIQHFIRIRGFDPVHPFYTSLLELWPAGTGKPIEFPITVIVGKVHG